jgi:hypothetical protein
MAQPPDRRTLPAARRAQRELLRRRFVAALGPGVLEAVKIETVDSFQARPWPGVPATFTPTDGVASFVPELSA